MYSILSAEAPASEDLWAVFAALRLLDEGADAIASARTEVARLADDAHWETKGVRRLRRALMELCVTLGVEHGELSFVRETVAREAVS